MEWWRKMVASPVKRVWVSMAARVKSRKTGRGILVLHNDVQSCGYRDIEIMWEMIQRSEKEHTPRRRKHPFWRVSAFLSHRRTMVDSGSKF